MLIHTWWCWHTLRRRWSLKGREGFGFLSPFYRACEAGFSAFEKMKCIFFYRPSGKFGEVAGVFFTRKTPTERWPLRRRMLAQRLVYSG